MILCKKKDNLYFHDSSPQNALTRNNVQRLKTHLERDGHINVNDPLAARQLTAEGYLEDCPIPNSFGSTTDISTKAGKWLRSLSGRGNEEDDPVLRLLPNQELIGAEKESVRAPGTISVAVSKCVSC